MRLAWSGHHIGRKALPIALRAIAEAKFAGASVELTVLGEGAETHRWKALAETLGVGPQVRWTGQLAHDDALAAVASSDSFVFPSVQEGTPHVVLEALSLGLPVICHDACGMGVAVDERCGIKIPMVDAATSVGGFADAIQKLATRTGELNRLSRGALSRTRELSWDVKANQIAETYRRVASQPAMGGGR